MMKLKENQKSYMMNKIKKVKKKKKVNYIRKIQMKKMNSLMSYIRIIEQIEFMQQEILIARGQGEEKFLKF